MTERQTTSDLLSYLDIVVKHFIRPRRTVLDAERGGGGCARQDDAATAQVLDEGRGEVRQARDVHVLVGATVEEGGDVQTLLL